MPKFDTLDLHELRALARREGDKPARNPWPAILGALALSLASGWAFAAFAVTIGA